MRSFSQIKLMAVVLSITEVPLFANTISIQEAEKKGLIKLIIKSKGGYTGSVIEMNVTNNTSHGMGLKVEAGRKLDSKTDSQQDILVTHAQEVFVSAKQKISFNIKGMCCQAHNSSPKAGAFYSIGVMADSNLIKIAQYIDKNKYYEDHTAQQAVWTVSDDNSLGSITGSDKKVVDGLRNYVSKVTGKVIPPYEVKYGNGSDTDLLGHPTSIEGVFSYTLPINCHADVVITDQNGRVVQLLFEDLTHERGDYKLYYTFRTRNIPKGTYYAILRLDGAAQKKEKIEV